VRFIVAPDHLAVIGRGQPVHDLDGGVLDDVGDELGGDLLGDDQALAVGADLGQQPGEHLHRLRGRAAGLAPGLAEQPVSFFEDRQVPQPRRGGALGALPQPQPQVLDQADRHRSHQERLVPVIAGVLDLENHVAPQQPAKSSGWPPCRNRPVVPSRRLEIRTLTNPRTLSVIPRPYPMSSTTWIAVACRSSRAG
jgi:hypothetical protein